MISLRRLVPTPVRAARGHWHWLRGTDVYAGAPLASFARLTRWMILNFIRPEIAFATQGGLKFVSAPNNSISFALYFAGCRDPEIEYQQSNPGETHVAADGKPTGARVELVTLDDTLARLGIERIDYLKIDVEGYELQVLQGARDTIGRSPGIIVQTELIERHLRRYGTAVADVAAFLRRLGLTPHIVDGDGGTHRVADGMAMPAEVVWLRV